MKPFPIVLIALSLCFAACEKTASVDDGPTESQIYVPSEAGVTSVSVNTEGAWSAALSSSAKSWLSLDAASGNGDSDIKVTYKSNPGFCRKGLIIFTVPDRKLADTLVVKQYGKAEYLEFASESLTIPGQGTDDSVGFSSNLTALLLNTVKFGYSYQDDSLWLAASLDVTSKAVKFRSKVNQSGKPRTCIVGLYYTDAWNRTQVSRIKVTQQSVGGTSQTTVISIAKLKSMISALSGSLQITEDSSIEGLVVSDHSDGNVAINPNSTSSLYRVDDYTVNYRTAYLETEDAASGIALLFDQKSSNLLTQKSRAKIWLKGATLTRYDNPVRYILSGISSRNIISNTENAVSHLPEKVKTISSLTDEDLYTFVTIKDCELPVRKGSYTPINEGYGSLYGANRVDAFPILLRDKTGGSMYLMTNLDCKYRRDGNALPEGSGTVSGVLVHEEYYRFDKNGDIGRYQLRHLFQSDIAIGSSSASSFSSIIAEWNIYSANMTASTGSGSIKHNVSSMYQSNDYHFLGPMTGVETEDGKGRDNGSWACTGWWNASEGEGNYWLVTFSTAGISTDVLSIQFAALNTSIGAPRYWAVEYSTDASSWSRVLEYSVPDLVQWDNTLLNQSAGFKQVNVTLPSSLCGKDKVYVRLVPVKNDAGSAYAYDGSTISSTAGSAITYLSVRYNHQGK